MKVDTAALKAAVSMVGTQTDEFTIYPDEEGWAIRATSLDHVTLMDIVIRTAAFEKYSLWPVFAVKAADILDALSTADAYTDISLEDNRLIIKSNGLRYRKRLMVPEEGMMRRPDLNLDCRVTLRTDGLSKLMSKGDVKYGRAIFELSPEGLSASIMDEQELGVTLDVPKDQCSMFTVPRTVRAAYPCSAWVPFLKALPKSAELTMGFDTDYPLIATVETDNLSATWLVAPHLLEDD